MKYALLLTTILTACGGSSGGGSDTPAVNTATQTSTATTTSTTTTQTATSTATDTSLATGRPPVGEITSTLLSIKLGSALADQPKAVQDLANNPLFKPSSLTRYEDPCLNFGSATAHSSGGDFYSDGSDKLNFEFVEMGGVVINYQYQLNSNPSYTSTPLACSDYHPKT